MDTNLKNKLEQYCAYQERCKYDVIQKAKKLNILDDEIDGYLQYLESNNFLNETRFVTSFVEGHFYQKKWGKNKIKQALQQKKIASNLIATILADLDKNDVAETILGLAQKKWNSIKSDNAMEKKQKVIRFLLGRGFAYSDIAEAMKKVS